MTGADSSLWRELWLAVVAHSVPTSPPALGGLWPVPLLTVLFVLVPRARHLGRALGTVVHEAAHAVVGVLVGRRFHGFTVASDLSGVAVTSGPQRGLGRVLTSWAGYPAPALLGAGLTAAALRGWAGMVLAVLCVGLLLLLVMSRSLRTALLVGMCVLLFLGLWWWGDALLPLRAGVLAGVGMVLLLSAWDALLDVARSRDGGQDHRTLERITVLPAWLWVGSWLLVCTVCTWAVLQTALPLRP